MFEDYQPRPRALWIAAVVFFAAVVTDSWFRWATFQYGTFDAAFYTQSMWLATKGIAHGSLLDVALMGNHAEPIMFLMVPLFWIFPSPMTLVIVQALLMATMPFTAWRIARRMEFERKGALGMALAVLVAPAAGFVALHEFHPEALAAPLILLMLEARLAHRLGTFWVTFLLAVACKENVALMLGWMCAVHWLLERDRGREWEVAFNIVPGALALGWVALYGLWISPAMNGGRVDYGELYSHIGGEGKAGIFGAAWNGLTGGNLVRGLLLPFALLPLLRPRWLFVAAPIFAQHLLSSRQSEWSLNFHYAAPLLPLLWMGAVEGCGRLFWREVMARWVLIACVACQAWFGPLHSLLSTMGGASEALWARTWKAELLARIPADASVVAGMPYLSHLAKRERLHSLHHILKGLGTLSRADYTSPAPTDFVVVDAGDGATFNRKAGYFHPQKPLDGRVIEASEVLLHRFLARANWETESRNEMTIFKRSDAAPERTRGGGVQIADGLSFVTSEPRTPAPGDSALLALTWECGAGRTMLPWASVMLIAPGGSHHQTNRGPVTAGIENGRVTELWALRPPPSVPAGKYRGVLLLQDGHAGARMASRSFDLGEITVP